MSYLEALLVAKARVAGRAQRSARFRHRRLVDRPMGMVLWQLGAEPFTAAAVAWGHHHSSFSLAVPGEPRDRELAFRALLSVAKGFNDWFESASEREEAQVVVPNRGNLTLLGRLGRRLAYLSTDGDRPADPALVRFGLHLRFLAEHARKPGQQLVVVLTELISTHWVTELSKLEEQSLPALDAAIEPPPGLTGSDAAARAESLEIGPMPGSDEDGAVDPLVQALNEGRARRTEESVVAPLRRPIEAHYRELVERGWPLMWRAWERERRWPEARHVQRRWQEDVDALKWHCGWVVEQGGRYRTSQTHAQAARRLRSWEDAERLRVAEEAIDDPLRMVPVLLTGHAFAGTVRKVDLDHRVQLTRSVKRPRFAVETDQACEVLREKELYWTETPEAGAYDIVDVVEGRRAGTWLVTLQHSTGSTKWRHPVVGEQVVYSIHSVAQAPPLFLPRAVPWSHTAPPQEALEAEEGTPWE